MQRLLKKSIRWSLPFLIVAFVCTESEPTEQAQPVGDKVQVLENPGSITLSNGLVSITLNKKTAQLTSLKAGKKGELLAGGGRGYYDMTAGRVDLSGPTFKIVRVEDDVAEVAFTKVIGGFTNEVHYALRKGEKGLHVFAIHRYAKGTNTPFPEESRFVLRVDPKIFTYAYTSEKKHGRFPLPAAIKAAKAVMDATYLLLDGLLYSKYDWADFLLGHWGHGATGDGVGIWILHGSMEYFIGGPTRQELMIHTTDTTPVLLEMYTGNHFLGKATEREFPKEGGWSKLYGPTFIYVNEGKDGDTMMKDAKAQAAKLESSWPYQWMKNDLYPLERGKAHGQLKLPSGAGAADAVVFMTSPCKDWQVQFKDYLFTTRADKDGKFQIKNIRPGGYTLYAYAPGIIGEYRKDNVTVKANGEVDFGAINWTPPTHGKTLWQVGTSDRLAAEFRHGDEPRAYGLWDKYSKDFPNGVNFIIGKSKERTDWNFAQFPGTTWKIQFDMNEMPKGKATLTVAVAGAAGSPSVTVLANGAKVGSLKYDNDSSVPRSGNQAGRYRLNYVTFDASVLKQGQNTVSLQMGGPLFKSAGVNARPGSAIMYDCVRLEVNDVP
ncbi:MAG TPA: polysaccharide lyase family protein [Gemmataceae bacterium]|nr:polysaccharide lyase family protein [Gemmataceae bacterium]